MRPLWPKDKPAQGRSAKRDLSQGESHKQAYTFVGRATPSCFLFLLWVALLRMFSSSTFDQCELWRLGLYLGKRSKRNSPWMSNTRQKPIPKVFLYGLSPIVDRTLFLLFHIFCEDGNKKKYKHGRILKENPRKREALIILNYYFIDYLINYFKIKLGYATILLIILRVF